ncbi:hypothetical protein EGT74_04730 [Chitinophaga lutea]|uniref:Uncharacterized protein n=1 Tax=Chitinophaga lutea TaxID=2488634 RepID=A0A3N4PW21_9BACT|nr:hypothetical protein [Chitinophaga lutea]RPE12852.1 hypothetical protein EGT74_04730 [Chitinophaga lutea]
MFAVLGVFIVALGIRSCAEQKRTGQLLRENERLIRENRDLRNSLTLSSRTAQQIADRKDMQVQAQAQFIDRREYFRRNWKQYISVNTGDYKTGFLGGIKDLRITVRNQTEYPLDNAVVQVQYLRGNGGVFKTEQYTVHNIPEKGALSVQASNSRKGTKVNISLLSVTSQPMNFCWSRDKRAAPGDADPWACVPAAK